MVINTDADVIRVMRENPRLVFQALREDDELLGEVRRLVLTEDVLAIPGQLADVIETQREMLKMQANILVEMAEQRQTQTKILADQAEMRRTQANILADQAEMRRTQNKLLETQTKMMADLDDLKLEHAQTRRIQNRMDGRMGNLYGADLERRLPRILLARLFEILELHRPRILLCDNFEPQREFLDRVQDAAGEEVISMENYRRITDTDMILQARSKKSGETVYCAAEASSVIDSQDVDRAIETAKILNTIYGDRSIPVVVGYSVTDAAQNRADTWDVTIIILNQR